jgi:putative tricarboxylic transport membrane protein
MSRFMLLALSLPIILWPSSGAFAQSAWKLDRPVEIVSGTTGGGADRMARLIQHLMQEKRLVTTPVSVVAKVGAGNSIAYHYVSQKPGDPHFLLASTLSLSVGHLTGRTKLGYRDFTPLCILFDEYVTIVSRSDSQIRTGKDLIDRLKADPGSLSIGLSSALGSATHLAVAMVLRAAGIDVKKLRIVVFDSASKGIIAMMGGHVDISASSLSSAVPQLQAGTICALGITSQRRSGGVYAQTPTWREQGADAWFSSYRGVSGAKDIGEAQIAFWENVFTAVDQDPRWHEEGEKYLVDRQFRKSRETRKYLDDLDGPMKSLLNELGLIGQGA